MKLKEHVKSLFTKKNQLSKVEVNVLPELEETPNGLLVSSNGYVTKVEQKSDTVFAIGAIEGDKNQIIELADFINNAQSVIHGGIFADSDSYVDSVSFSYDSSRPGNAPEIIFGITVNSGNDEQDEGEIDGFGRPVSLGKSAREKLPKDGFIKQNIEKIATYMDRYIKDRHLDHIESSFAEEGA